MKISKFYPWVLLGGSAVGLVASVWQAAERVQMLKHPAAALSCNLNPVIDCSGVLGNRWAALFGFPNAFIGIAIFAMLLMAGVVLASGMKPSKLFSKVLFAVGTILILFSFWFFGMSLYVIGKVCIFCLFIWAVSVPIFWYGKLNYFQTYPLRKPWLKKWFGFFEKHHLDVLLLVYVVMIAMYLARFRTYYFG
ncbi:MAG: vitamin K epoxide reductase family protein [Candidatus Saccharimonadales bacterium]